MRPAHPMTLSKRLCSSGPRIWNTHCKPNTPSRFGLQNSNRIQSRSKSYYGNDQAYPIQGFYAELLKKPIKEVTPMTSTSPTPPPAESLPKTEKEETLEKARIIFGSRLAGPGERKAEIDAASHVVAGIKVPPKPTEPDNCCMSGCVNCVWDMYRDEMEEWAAKSAEARAAIQARREEGQGTGTMVAGKGTPSHVATSMDDDGGGSETNWSEGMDEEKLFDDIPVGIREFMKTEKKLKQRHKEEGSMAENA